MKIVSIWEINFLYPAHGAGRCPELDEKGYSNQYQFNV